LTDSRASYVKRSRLPWILWPEDVALVMGLASPRSARAFLLRHGVPHARIGGRVYVTRDTLLAFLQEQEMRHPTKEEVRKKVDEDLKRIAPTARQRRTRQCLPLRPPKKGS
jgi:hypothetical protein